MSKLNGEWYCAKCDKSYSFNEQTGVFVELANPTVGYTGQGNAGQQNAAPQNAYNYTAAPAKKKKKKVWPWVVGILVLLIIIGSAAGGKKSSSSTSSAPAKSADTTTTPASTDTGETASQTTTDASTDTTTPAAPAEDNSINADKFNQIQQGMSYEEVKAIIGEDGENTSENEIAGTKTVVYEWSSKTGWGNASVTFQNDQVVNKTQFGVASGDQVKVTLDMYNQVQTGMSYDDVKGVFGGEGTLMSQSEIAGYSSEMYQWSGKSLGSNCVITFSDGAVDAKSQYGLE